MKRFRNVVLGVLLCCFAAVAVFGFSGCGKVTISTFAENLEKLDATYEKYSDIFTISQDTSEEYYILINYGDTRIDTQINSGTAFTDLKEVYNATLVIANQYVENNREYVTNYEKTLSKSSKSALKALNSSLVEYIDSIEDFVSAHDTLVTYCTTISDTTGDSAAVQTFRKSYGKMVTKSVDLSSKMANFVETTEILSLLKTTTLTPQDTETIKQYIRAKLLPIFSELRIAEVSNKMNWDERPEGDCKTEIDAILKNLNNAFETFKTDFVRTSSTKELSGGTDAINQIFDLTEEFFEEADSYFTALSKLDLQKLAVDYENVMEKYVKSNQLARVYLAKVEYFVGSILPTYMSEIMIIINA